jgi:hypothetical protein
MVLNNFNYYKCQGERTVDGGWGEKMFGSLEKINSYSNYLILWKP